MRRPIAAVAAAVSVLALAACGSGRTGQSTVELLKTPAPAAAAPGPSAAAPDCGDPRTSYAPAGITATTPVVEAIKKRGRLIVGVSADTLQLGARNPITNKIEGFDIDMARYVAQAIFGDDKNRIQFKVITAGERISALTKPVSGGGVDMVARAMTMNCARWADIAFSSQYYQAGQKLLVGTESTITDLEALKKAKQKVCVQRGTTTFGNVTKVVGEELVVPAATATDCLVAFQQGAAEAIASDDTILAGLAAQDPYAKIVGDAVTEEPYGLGLPGGEKATPKQKDFARFVNGVLQDVRQDGRWQRSYDRWLKPELGAASAPKAQYGRT